MIEDSSSDEEDEFHNRNVHIFYYLNLKVLIFLRASLLNLRLIYLALKSTFAF